jgi:hypothetical protein
VAKRVGLHEVRTRVTCHLPVNNEQEEKAFFKILEYLQGQRQQGLGIQGYTHSSLRPAAFHGYWWSDELGEWFPDDIVLCIVDYKLPFGARELSAKVKDFKRTVRKWYRHYGNPQDEIWVVAQQIIRQD